MDSRKVIVLTFSMVLLILVVSETVQAQKINITATEILDQIQNEFGINRDYSDKLILGEFNLTEIYIDKNIVIRNSIFKDSVDLKNIIFRYNPVNFQGSSFLSKTSFKGVRFDENANFRNVNFSNDVDFSGTNFNGQWANFNNANFTGNVSFNDANFNSADFTGANFYGSADFTGAKFNKVYFINTTFSKLNKVVLNESEYNTMIGSFNSFEENLVFNDGAYIKLIKNFKENGQFEDSDNTIYKYRQLKQESKKGFSWLWDEIQRITYGYGVKPFNSIVVGIIIIIFFSFFLETKTSQIMDYNGSCTRLSHTIEKILPDKLYYKYLKINEKIIFNRFYFKCVRIIRRCLYIFSPTKPTWNSLYYSFLTFITIGFKPEGDDRVKLYTIIEGILGWLILSFFLVTLANQIIRQ